MFLLLKFVKHHCKSLRCSTLFVCNFSLQERCIRGVSSSVVNHQAVHLRFKTKNNLPLSPFSLHLNFDKSVCQTSQTSSTKNKFEKKAIGSVESPENILPATNANKNLVLHHGKRGIIFVLPEISTNDSSLSHQYNSTADYPCNSVTDRILEETRRQASNINREDIDYYEEIVKEPTIVNPVIGPIPVNLLQWKTQEIDIKNLPKYYASLAKSRLTGLVVLTSMAGYFIAPAPFDMTSFLLCSLGTTLVSSSANSINQFFEVPFDSQMDRTKNRVLVRGLLTPLHAVTFGLTCGFSGISLLYFGVNGLTAGLGILNLLLYTSVYTPMKRVSIINTWLGSVVGAIPPLMGWAACTGSLEPGALIIGGILFAWQFPHFNALSWNLRQDYSRAGHSMMSVLNPGLCQRTSLRYSVAIILLSTLSPICGVTTWTFAIDSLPLNLCFIYLAWRFYKNGDSKSSRNLFRFSLIHLPAILMLMIISRQTSSPSESKAKTD